MKFNFLQREKLYKAFQVNSNVEIKQVDAVHFNYFIIENFLVDPVAALNYFMEFPVLHPPFHICEPGGRQNISSNEYDLV